MFETLKFWLMLEKQQLSDKEMEGESNLTLLKMVCVIFAGLSKDTAEKNQQLPTDHADHADDASLLLS